MILAVDRKRRNLELLTELLSKEGYDTRGSTSLEEFDAALGEPAKISIALVDLAGFDASIWQRCDRLREAGIPFLLISSRQVGGLEEAILAHGARGVLVKPLLRKQLLGIIRGLLEE